MLRILSLGAGVQSSTVLLMSGLGQLPRLDAAVFADTQWEPAAVYAHLDWLTAEAGRCGIPVLRGTRGDLRADAIEFRRTGGKASGKPGAKRHASMPFFVKNPDGSQGMINRQCTSEYKIEVVERIVRRDLLHLAHGQRAPAGAVEHWFGISADEFTRRRRSTSHWQTFRYPLLDDVSSPVRRGLYDSGYTRADCLAWMEARGYPRPPRSACIGCPYRSDREWAALTPEEFADACAFDDAMRGAAAAHLEEKGAERFGRLIGLPYLHRTMVPLSEVKLRVVEPTDERLGWDNECAGVCGV